MLPVDRVGGTQRRFQYFPVGRLRGDAAQDDALERKRVGRAENGAHVEPGTHVVEDKIHGYFVGRFESGGVHAVQRVHGAFDQGCFHALRLAHHFDEGQFKTRQHIVSA